MPERISRQRGVALITVLLIVASMSAVAVSLTHGLTETVKRSRALESQAQLRLHAVAAEETARTELTRLVMESGAQLNRALPGFEAPIRFPLEGGLLEITVTDYSNCFDANQVFRTGNGGSTDGDTSSPAQDLQTILTAQGLDPGIAVELSAGLADWIDPDLSSRLGGAEDGYYSQLQPPYRTSGLPLETDSELLAIRGFAPALLAEVEDLVCVIPSHAQTSGRAVNINTLRLEQAARLAPVFGDALTADEIRQLIANRPLGGWASVDDFLADPLLVNLSPDIIRQSELATVSSFVAITARVAYRGQAMVMTYLFELQSGQSARLLRRERTS